MRKKYPPKTPIAATKAAGAQAQTRQWSSVPDRHESPFHTPFGIGAGAGARGLSDSSETDVVRWQVHPVGSRSTRRLSSRNGG
eukprot:scaffold106232_cov114-Phaeocystis_antarctica.AAC.2